ncbi:SMI1/KNR4 family protein [Aggregatibacter actinomycetemcomitans]|uniref:SMI1/KNR4 family protein n=1 Tax=Aggregatibacter actinomycetemcomitans TaxID=714 RepID=UPI00197CA171|nr:SMI1/KNR4 family protein [Aggregatibacter actinomycetemcomitans]MBN6074854.1 SMI1/KNR4 family protein [Aggregatibacter actinomycetemcomitans]
MENLKLTLLLDEIKNNKNCNIQPPLEGFTSQFKLPEDLQDFYKVCNGVELFRNCDYPYRILGIEELEPINLLIIGELCPEDISSNWVSIAEDYNGDYLSLDLSPKKLGWCYDSFHETHGLVGDTPVIAKSFTELLYRLYDNKGDYTYWFKPEFNHIYGDAYD